MKCKATLLVAIIICIAILPLTQTQAASKTVVLTYSNLGRNITYWGTIPDALRNAGYNVISLIPTNYKLADYTTQIEQQIYQTPHATFLTFSDSDLPVTVAASRHPALVDRIIFVESVEEFSKYSFSDQALGVTAVGLANTFPTYIINPIFVSLGSYTPLIYYMLESMVVHKPASFNQLVTITADGTPLFAVVDTYYYSQTRVWQTYLSYLKASGVKLNAIVSTPEPQQWAAQNGIPYTKINDSGHLCQLEQPTQVITALKNTIA